MMVTKLHLDASYVVRGSKNTSMATRANASKGKVGLVGLALAVGMLLAPAWTMAAATSSARADIAALPDAPMPAAMLQFGGGPGSVGTDGTGTHRKSKKKHRHTGAPPGAPASQPPPGPAPIPSPCAANASSDAASKMSCEPAAPATSFKHYLKSPLVAPMTAKDKFYLATRDTFDPFNLLTIVGSGTIAVEDNAHGIYGPGIGGIARYSGVNFTENMAGEYFGTFMVCSIAHQDPHYHREPNLSIQRRVLHSIVQVAWTQSDTGKGMFNYANFFGGAATAAVSNTFVPGPNRQGWGNTSKRLTLALITSPTGNMVTEFVPDIARHINLHVVIFQQILNMVTTQEGWGPL